MKLSQLLSAIGADCPQDPEITALTCDSREVVPGALFAALEGSRADGRAHIPEALERGFFIRLESAGAQAPWRPAARPKENFSPVRMEALRAAFLDDAAEVPEALDRRLQKLRDALAVDNVRLSRHTLDLMWKYCAAMIKLNCISAGEALDLAFAQKALPCILAEAPIECLSKLKALLANMPHSLALLNKPLPIQI